MLSQTVTPTNLRRVAFADDFGQERKVASRRRFSLIPAFTEGLQEEVFRIRHQVFCEEYALFPTRPDGLETDEHDQNSILLLLRNPDDGAVGCVRVVKTSETQPNSPLPFEQACPDVLGQGSGDFRSLSRTKIAEVSRLGVVNSYRRRKGDVFHAGGVSDSPFCAEGYLPNRRQFPYLLIKLYLGSIAVAVLEGIEQLFTFTELRLVTHFSKLGVPIKPISPPVNYKGIRLPCMLDVSETVKAFNPFIRVMYDVTYREIRYQYSSCCKGSGTPTHRAVGTERNATSYAP